MRPAARDQRRGAERVDVEGVLEELLVGRLDRRLLGLGRGRAYLCLDGIARWSAGDWIDTTAYAQQRRPAPSALAVGGRQHDMVLDLPLDEQARLAPRPCGVWLQAIAWVACVASWLSVCRLIHVLSG